MVEAEAGMRLARVEIEPHEAALTLDLSALRPIVRIADENDLKDEEETISAKLRPGACACIGYRSAGLR